MYARSVPVFAYQVVHAPMPDDYDAGLERNDKLLGNKDALIIRMIFFGPTNPSSSACIPS